jgi:hypothetical protein
MSRFRSARDDGRACQFERVTENAIELRSAVDDVRASDRCRLSAFRWYALGSGGEPRKALGLRAFRRAPGGPKPVHFVTMGGGPKRVVRPTAVVISMWLLASAGCGGQGTAAPSASSVIAPGAAWAGSSVLNDLEGTWSGDWRGTNGTKAGGLRIEWQRVGRVVRGGLTLSGDDCLPGGTITGILDDGKVVFEALSVDARVTFSALKAGDSLDGTFTTTCSEATGAWSAKKA